MKKQNDVKKQTELSFQLGGAVQMPGTNYTTTPNPGPTTGFRPYVAPSIPGSPQPVQTDPQYQGVQLPGTQFIGATERTNIPTFGQTVGTNPGQYDEFKTYVNSSGQILRIPFKNGQPLYPIPQGYTLQKEDVVKTESTVPTTTVGQDEDKDDTSGDGDSGGLGVSGAVQGPASKSTGLTGIQNSLSNIADYVSGKPAQAGKYGGTTLSGLTKSGTITDFSNNLPGVQDALGVYGTGPVDLGIVGNILSGNILGTVASSLKSELDFGSSTEAFGQAAPAGFGAFSTSQLEDYARGTLNPADAALVGIAMDKNQAFARAEVQRAIGTPITGIVGHKKGDISPVTGTPYNQYGQVVNFKGSTTGVDTGFASFGDWMGALKAGVASGYYGGWKSAAEVKAMNPTMRANYEAYAKARGGNPNGQGAGTPGKDAEMGLGEKGGEVSPTPGGTAGTPGSQGRADYGGGYPGGAPSAPSAPTMGIGETGPDRGDNNNDSGGGFDGSEGFGSGDDAAAPICLTEDMKVKRNGVVDFVTKVQVGDIIGNTVVTEVLHKHMREGYYVVNGELKITNDHPVLANGLWKRTEDLVLGDYINNVEVTSLEYIEQVTPTVYIGTADDRYDVYTEGEVYTVHGQYKNALNKAA